MNISIEETLETISIFDFQYAHKNRVVDLEKDVKKPSDRNGTDDKPTIFEEIKRKMKTYPPSLFPTPQRMTEQIMGDVKTWISEIQSKSSAEDLLFRYNCLLLNDHKRKLPALYLATIQSMSLTSEIQTFLDRVEVPPIYDYLCKLEHHAEYKLISQSWKEKRQNIKISAFTSWESLERENSEPIALLQQPLLGQGQYSVHLGVTSSQIWAIKSVSMTMNNREIQYLTTLVHENIIKYRGSIEKGTNYYLLFDYAPWTLAEYITTFETPGWIRRQMILGLVNGVSFIHGEHKSKENDTKFHVHGDLKPQNVLVTSDSILKICDFGSCRISNSYGVFSDVIRDQGTRGWRNLNISDAKHRDLHSCSLLIGFITFGRHPCGEDNREEKVKHGEFSIPTDENAYNGIPMKQFSELFYQLSQLDTKPNYKTIRYLPLLWSTQQTKNFFIKFRDYVEKKLITYDEMTEYSKVVRMRNPWMTYGEEWYIYYAKCKDPQFTTLNGFSRMSRALMVHQSQNESLEAHAIHSAGGEAIRHLVSLCEKKNIPIKDML